MTHSFNVYIDESGDDGLSNFREPGSGGGASNWLVIGACVVRSSRDLELVALRDKIKADCQPNSKGRSVHFKDIKHHNQKRRACQVIGGQPLRFSAVLGLKNTTKAKGFTEKNQLYFYLTRYLLERVSWLCRDYRRVVKEGDGRAKITFSRRGGMSYEEFRNYLERLRSSHQTQIHWPAIDVASVDAQDHSRLAGLQIADIGTSAIAAAIEPDKFGNVEDAYISEIADNIYSNKGNHFSYGLKMLPKLEDANPSKAQTKAFLKFR